MNFKAHLKVFYFIANSCNIQKSEINVPSLRLKANWLNRILYKNDSKRQFGNIQTLALLN